MRRLFAVLPGIFLSAVCLTGCWDRTELNELAITSASAVDLDKNRWILSFQVIIPSAISGAAGTSGGPSSQVPVVVHSTNGSTIKDAVSKSYLEAPRKLYFGHNSVLVIGENAARQGFSQMIDLYLRNPDSRETVNVLIASGDGRTILEQLINMDNIPGQGIQRILEKESEYLSILPNTRMYELTKHMLSPSKSGLLPEIIISGGKEITSVDQLKQTTMPSKLRLGRAAIIKDDKLIGWMDHEEALGTAFLGGKVRSSTLPFSCTDNATGMNSTFVLTKASTKTAIQKEDGSYLIDVKIKVKGRLNETSCAKNLIKPDVIKKMEDNVSQRIETITNKAWAAMQKADADTAGFSDILYRKYPKDWKELEKKKESALKKFKLKVQVSTTMDKVGLSNKGYNKVKEPE